MNQSEDLDLSVSNDGSLDTTKVTGDIVKESLLCVGVKDSRPELTWLLGVLDRVESAQELLDLGTCELLVVGRNSRLGLVSQWSNGRLVVGAVALVSIDGCKPISLEVGNGHQWCVDGDLLVVDSQSVSVSVWV